MHKPNHSQMQMPPTNNNAVDRDAIVRALRNPRKPTSKMGEQSKLVHNMACNMNTGTIGGA